jgi:hypothetical protein
MTIRQLLDIYKIYKIEQNIIQSLLRFAQTHFYPPMGLKDFLNCSRILFDQIYYYWADLYVHVTMTDDYLQNI